MYPEDNGKAAEVSLVGGEAAERSPPLALAFLAAPKLRVCFQDLVPLVTPTTMAKKAIAAADVTDVNTAL